MDNELLHAIKNHTFFVCKSIEGKRLLTQQAEFFLNPDNATSTAFVE